MHQFKVDYSKKRDCFRDTEPIASDLIWGNEFYVERPWMTYVIPAYGRAELLEETLNSVLKQQEVDFPWDIIVVDNEAGGENDTERMIRRLNEPRILYYRNRENLGVDGNYNRCIFLARGQWVAMLHADDLVLDDHLRLMGEYIRQESHGRKKLAYISPAYIEFSDADKIHLRRPEAGGTHRNWQELALLEKKYHGNIKRFRRIDGVLSGYSVALPSFGTVMNREIMIKEGGFDKELGICEDVVTPYRLAGKYRVCVTPVVMGYYRFGTNYSMRPEVILRIFEAMVDFREYMYTQNLITKMCGKIVRNQHNKELMDYCIKLSRFSDRRLTQDDFTAIYQLKKQSHFSVRLFKCVKSVYRHMNGIGTDLDRCRVCLQNIKSEIAEEYKKNRAFIIYGAGMAGKCTYKFLKKHFKGIQVLGYAVTTQGGMTQVDSVPVIPLSQLKEYYETAVVITATVTIEYQDEMLKELKNQGFRHVINLLK